MQLSEYFASGYQDALDAYSSFALAQGWPVEEKLRLYSHAETAFSDYSFSDFAEVYDSLRRYWQVFRNATNYWSARDLFDFLTSADAQRFRELRLVDVWDEVTREKLLSFLNRLKPLKTTSRNYYPYMPVSKVLHFFNPKAFPIYDTAVFWNRVNKTFGELTTIRVATGVSYSDYDGSFNLMHTLSAARLIQASHPSLMQHFAGWCRAEARKTGSAVSNDIEQYYATAFEFVCIGATVIEESRGRLPGAFERR